MAQNLAIIVEAADESHLRQTPVLAQRCQQALVRLQYFAGRLPGTQAVRHFPHGIQQRIVIEFHGSVIFRALSTQFSS